MMRIVFVLIAFVVVAIPATLRASDRPTNVVLILADDLGYNDLGIQGSTDIPTPNIDALARSGARFTQGYVTCPVCFPSRVALLTGRQQQRLGFDNNPDSLETISGNNWGLPLTETNIAQSLKPAGYATAAFGKWQVGWGDGFHPTDRGFDEFFGMASGNSYLRFYLPDTDEADWQMAKGKGLPETMTNGRRFVLHRQKRIVDEPEYLTDAFARDAADFIDRQARAGKPFFVYFAPNAVHLPLQASRKYLDRFPALEGGRKVYAAMTSALDDAVGRLTAKLREHNLEDNTLIIFLSDNGGPSPGKAGAGNFSSNAPLRGRKGTMYEGGIRVPFFVSWKGRIPAGSTHDLLVSCLDLLPTILDAAALPHAGERQLDGSSLLPIVRDGSTTAVHRQLFWRYQNHLAVRDSRWKLIRFADRPPELYDLSKDIGETENLYTVQPDVVALLNKSLDDWNSQFPPPKWSNPDVGKRVGAD